MHLNDKQRSTLQRSLLAWYHRHKRDLPWRTKPTLYYVLLSEFMLQQTRIDQALPYYHRFLKRFPTMKKLAAADLDEVLKLWEGLGYYRRAKYLHETAKRLAGKRKVDLETLADCPGIGPYCLAAVSSIVWGEPLAVIDGNVNRVMARMLALKHPPTVPEGKRAIAEVLADWLPHDRPGDWNQAVMELGATVCLPAKPQCLICPLNEWCLARKEGAQASYPLKLEKKARPHKHISAAVIRRKDGQILIAQRPPDGLLPNLWEFPGGKQEPGETLEACCAREVKEELNINVDVGGKLAEVSHGYSHFTITLHVFDCRYRKGRPKTIGCQAFQWVRTKNLAEFAFPRANWAIIEQLTGEAGTRGSPSKGGSTQKRRRKKD